MKNKQAFTLIELLVVVLIIGILAAVAMPQYQKAVEKSRATQALTLLKSVGQAVSAYYVASGTSPESFDELSVDVPAGWTGTEQAVQFGNLMKDTRSNGDWSLQLFQSDLSGTMLFMVRLNGPYKGGGFMLNVISPTGETSAAIKCRETRASGIVFEGEPGDYCVKIMRATYDSQSESVRVYLLP